MLEKTELARLLTLYPILHELPAPLQHAIVDSAYAVHLPAGAVIFDSGRFIPFSLFLTSGSIRVSRLGAEREILLYRVQPGQICILSVCHLLASTHYQAVASTEHAVTGVTLPARLFASMVEGSPLFCAYLFRSLSERLGELLALVEAISFSRLDKRLAELLLVRGATMQITHSQLADELGSVREVVSRILKEFERQGIVQLGRNHIKIVDRPALAQIASGSHAARSGSTV